MTAKKIGVFDELRTQVDVTAILFYSHHSKGLPKRKGRYVFEDDFYRRVADAMESHGVSNKDVLSLQLTPLYISTVISGLGGLPPKK